MKKNQVPLWPLYVADALLLLPVLAVVVPSIAGGGQPSGGALFLCTLAVLAGMVLALVPFALDYKIQSDQKRERADENQKNFEIIFDDLSSLRLSLAELVERVENNEALTADLPALSKGLSDLRDGAKQKFFEASESADSIAAGLSKTESAQKALKTSVEEIGADIVVLKELFSASQESLNDELAQMRAKIEANTAKSAEPVPAEQLQPAAEDRTEVPTETQTAEPDESAADGETENEPFSPAKILAGGLMQRALEQAQDTKTSVEKFVAKAAQPNEEQPVPAAETQTQVVSAEESPEEAEPNAADTEADSHETDTPPAPAAEQNPPQTEANAEASTVEKVEHPEDADEDFFDSADSPVNVESAQKTEGQPVSEPEKHAQNMLFDDIPLSRDPSVKPKKADAVITVNALIGIGNKPYLRGDGAGLSPDKGVQMDYLEIGKWRYVLPDFDGQLHFKILKNDSVPPSGESEFTISRGEKLDLNLAFPMDNL